MRNAKRKLSTRDRALLESAARDAERWRKSGFKRSRGSVMARDSGRAEVPCSALPEALRNAFERNAYGEPEDQA